MENEAFIDMDTEQEKEEPNDNNANGVKISNQRSKKRYSVKLRQTTMELSELSKQSNFDSNESLIAFAARQGRRSILKNQIVKAKEDDNIDFLDNSGFAALHHTARYNSVEGIEQLLKNGANVNVRSREDQLTPLHIAAR